MKIAIIIGHGKSRTGGYDPGAVNGNFHEFRIGKEVGKVASDKLKETYNADCYLFNYDGSMTLPEKIARFKTREYGFIAEIHLNAGGPDASGTEVYFMPGDNVGQGYATAISEALSAALGIPNRGAKPDSNGNYGIIQQTGPTACLVETCFISGTGDLERINNAAGQQRAGRAIADGIAKAAALGQVEKSGWISSEKGWRWYENGASVSARWVMDDGFWFYLGGDGTMLTGLCDVGGKKYYLNERAGAGMPLGACVITDANGVIRGA